MQIDIFCISYREPFEIEAGSLTKVIYSKNR